MYTTSPGPNPKPPKILIIGGGPAGSTTAFFLAKAGFHVTVAEISTLEPYGQGIDITDEALEVVKRMGILEKIKENTTGETGFALLGNRGEVIGMLAAGEASPTQEIEIMRGTLTKILADAAKAQGVRYRYGCTVSKIEQSPGRISAVLSDTNVKEEFTAIIGADGVASRTRKLAFPPEANENPYSLTDTYCAYFSMEADPQRRVPYSRLQHADKGRAIWMRPIDADGRRVSCYLIITSPNNVRLQEIATPGATPEQQKALLEELYSDMDGLKQHAVQGMHERTDFYFSRIMQVKVDEWHEGRCALVGDAAYCPSPLSGQGTTLALIGGYIIAGELAMNPTDPAAAFAEYQRKLEGLVKRVGVIPLGGKAPKVFEPQSRLGVWTLRAVFWAVSWVNLPRLMEYLPSFESQKTSKKFQLPEYDFTVARGGHRQLNRREVDNPL